MPRQIRFLTAWNCPKLLESGWRLLISLVDIGSTWPVAPSLDYLAPESCMNFSTTGNWSTFTAMSFCFCASESSAGLCNKGAFYRYKNYTWKWFFPIGVTALAPSKLWGMSLSASTHDAYIHKIAAASWSTKVHVDADTFCGKKVKRAVMIVSSEPYRDFTWSQGCLLWINSFQPLSALSDRILMFCNSGFLDMCNCFTWEDENWLLEDYTSLFNSVIKIFEKVNNSHQVL